MENKEHAELERNYTVTVFVTVFQDKKCLIELFNAIFDEDYDENAEISMVDAKQLYREKTVKIPRPEFVVLLFRCRNNKVKRSGIAPAVVAVNTGLTEGEMEQLGQKCT